MTVIYVRITNGLGGEPIDSHISMHHQEEQATPERRIFNILQLWRVHGNAQAIQQGGLVFADCGMPYVASMPSQVSTEISSPMYNLPSSEFPMLHRTSLFR